MDISAAHCQGISECLEIGHPELIFGTLGSIYDNMDSGCFTQCEVICYDHMLLQRLWLCYMIRVNC